MRIPLVGLFVALFLLAGCSDPGTSVEIRDGLFKPDVLEVAVGETVTWVNYDAIEHTVTPADKGAWGSQGSGDARSLWMGEGGSWSFTFQSPGTYHYYCIPHANEVGGGRWAGMVGDVVVESPAGANRGPP